MLVRSSVRRTRRCDLISRWSALLLLVVTGIWSAPVEATRVPGQNDAHMASAQEDTGEETVVVNGHRIKVHRPNHLRVAPDIARGRRRLEARAEAFAQCMRISDLNLLHDAIDGRMGYSSNRFAIGRLIQENAGCYEGLNLAPPPSAIEIGTCNRARVQGIATDPSQIIECRAGYNRAAILRRVIAAYASPLRLTPEQTTDPVVQARFNAREMPRNDLRRSDDDTMFQIAVCMVRLQPEASVDLVEASTIPEQYRLEDKIVDGAKECIGGAPQIGIDPSEFRDYITDSVYRWIVAARGVDSLIPAARQAANP